MAGTLLSLGGTQQFQATGAAPNRGSRPMSGCILTIYQANTSTAALVYQDIALTVPSPNPLTGDPTGRLPMFFVGDGFYRVRLSDSTGDITNGGFDFASVPSIGPSAGGGGGGGSVDATTVFQTGDIKSRMEQTSIPGWVRINGRTIGNASSGASERAANDCQALFTLVWGTYPDSMCPVVGGRGANANADWAASKQITLLDLRGRVVVGLDDMGSTASGRLSSGSTATPTTPGSALGQDTCVLTVGQLAAHAHSGATGTESVLHTHTATGQYLQFVNGAGQFSNPTAGAATQYSTPATGGESNLHTHGIFTDGANQAHPNMPPALLGTVFWKL